MMNSRKVSVNNRHEPESSGTAHLLDHQRVLLEPSSESRCSLGQVQYQRLLQGGRFQEKGLRYDLIWEIDVTSD
jgi:hypothetical protein